MGLFSLNFSLTSSASTSWSKKNLTPSSNLGSSDEKKKDLDDFDTPLPLSWIPNLAPMSTLRLVTVLTSSSLSYSADRGPGLSPSSSSWAPPRKPKEKPVEEPVPLNACFRSVLISKVLLSLLTDASVLASSLESASSVLRNWS